VDLELQTGRKRRLSVDDLFRKGDLVFLTITSGAHGTMLYRNGALITVAPQLMFPASSFEGRLILGDTAAKADSWSGELRGLAVYRSELTSAQVRRNYEGWVQNGRPDIDSTERNAGLYLMSERKEKIVHNSALPAPDLHIPDKYIVLDQYLLEPVWQEFSMTKSYWSAVLKNIVGLIPFGFWFYAYLVKTPRFRHAAAITVALGFAASLTIEIVQWFLPTRDSGTSDIVANTLGALCGVMLYRWSRRFGFVRRLLPG